MSEVDDVKLQPQVPIPMALDAEPVPVAAVDTWCCSSCESLCGGVPCVSSLCTALHEAWDKLIYFVKWVFGYTTFQQVDRFYGAWLLKEIPVRFQHPEEFAAVKAEWIADIRALPEAVQHEIFCFVEIQYRNQGIAWPANRSAQHEPFNAEEREALLNIIRPGDQEILGHMHLKADRAYTHEFTAAQYISFLHATWPEDLGTARMTAELLRWQDHLKHIPELTFRYAAQCYAKKNQTIFHGYTDVVPYADGKILDKVQLQVVLQEVSNRPGERTFMDALLQYQQQGT